MFASFERLEPQQIAPRWRHDRNRVCRQPVEEKFL